MLIFSSSFFSSYIIHFIYYQYICELRNFVMKGKGGGDVLRLKYIPPIRPLCTLQCTLQLTGTNSKYIQCQLYQSAKYVCLYIGLAGLAFDKFIHYPCELKLCFLKQNTAKLNLLYYKDALEVQRLTGKIWKCTIDSATKKDMVMMLIYLWAGAIWFIINQIPQYVIQ